MLANSTSSAPSPSATGPATASDSTAVVPRVRNWPIRCSSRAGNEPGGASRSNACRGSQASATIDAFSSSPSSSTTPRTRPPSMRNRATGAAVRSLVPWNSAARSSAPIRLAPPPSIPGPAAASRSNRLKFVPGDQGPAKHPATAGSASAAFSRSVSNHSFSQSATHIGGSRRSSSMPERPRRRRRSARRPRNQSPLASGRSQSRGGPSAKSASTGRTRARKARYAR